MPTDEDRREVAERLFELSGRIDTSDFDCLLAEAVRGHDFCETPCDDCHRRLAEELADLIEPSESKVKCVAEVKVDGERLEKLVHDAAVELTGIDREALLALAEGLDCKADDIIRAAKHAQFSGLGPRMEEAKHDAREWRCIARRIREALGVDDA